MVAAESQAERLARLAAKATGDGEDVEALRAKVARLHAELETSKRREAELKAGGAYRLGKGLLNVVTLGAAGRKS